MVIFDFGLDKNLSNWVIVDDIVMGGRSGGHMSMNDEGHGVFEGRVSLENNGGFSSVRHRFEPKNVVRFSTFYVRLKGDGKAYQFRVKSYSSDRHSYIYYFKTTGDWQTIQVPFADMVPGFRGRELDMSNYPGEVMSEIAILISNKKAENFKIELDSIGLQ